MRFTKAVVLLAGVLFSSHSYAKRKIVAVIDTGIKNEIMAKGYNAGICKMGHVDLTGTGLNDTHGHGTNVSGLIERGAHGDDYCQVIIKYYIATPDVKCAQEVMNKAQDAINDGESPTGVLSAAKELIDFKCLSELNAKRFRGAIMRAIALKVDYINISGGGVHPDDEEKALILKALNKGIKIISAAGNEKSDLANVSFYPAMYDDRVTVVGNGIFIYPFGVKKLKKGNSSNYGKRVDVWEDGDDQTAYGITMSGTSQSTAIFTGKLIHKDILQENK